MQAADRAPEPVAANPVGRPSKYSQALADRICAELADGRSLRSVCRDEGIPSAQTVFTWMRSNKEFLEQYARAKAESADALVEDMLEISDDARNDWMERHDENNPGWDFNGEHVQRSKLRVDTRKWAASKLNARRYGDKLELGGSVGGTLRLVNMTGIKIGGGSVE